MNSSHPFAPGAIERHRRSPRLGSPAQRLAVKRWTAWGAVFVLASGACGYALGYAWVRLSIG